MSQDQKPPSFTDDPSFQKSLADLDEGLDAPKRQPPLASQQPNDPLPAPEGRPNRPSVPAETSIFPESALLPDIGSAPLLSRFARQTEPAPSSEPTGWALPAADVPRPLVDLFPPVPVREHTRARAPAMGGAPPPRVARSAFAFQTASAPLPPAVPLTYEPFYGLSEKPFSLSPDLKFIYRSRSHDRVLQELTDAVGRGEPIMVLTGKRELEMMLCRSLVEQLGPRTAASFITDPVVSLEDVLKTMLVDFGVVPRDEAPRSWLAAATRQELTTAVGDFAASLAPLQASAVVVIDEAQNVASDMFEPLAALSERARADRRLQIILVGQPALTSLLHRTELRSLERQVVARCRLEPLAAEEISGYVVHRLGVSGTNPRVRFDEGAVTALYDATGGVPRLVNLVCDGALTRGYELSADVIDDRLIAAAAANLELAPVLSGTHLIARMAGMALAYMALMLVGAGAAAWLLRDHLSRILR